MVFLEISPEEIQSGQMTPEHLEAAVRAIEEDGFVVLQDVVDRAHLEVLRERMIADVQKILGRPDAPFNWNTGNVQQQPPPFPPYLFRDVLVNDMVAAVVHAVLGPNATNCAYTGNTALRSNTRQPVHADGEPTSGDEPSGPPAALVVNIPVVDMSVENGSTEIWPGTHRFALPKGAAQGITVPEAFLEQRRQVVPPIQPTVACGSVIIRDVRMWHAGMPNRTDTPRPMIALIPTVGHGEEEYAIVAPKGTESYFEHPLLRWIVRFEEQPTDHIQHAHAYDYHP